MKEYVLARKWRPKKFSEVVGQDFAIKSIASGLKAQKVHHAYLLTGPRHWKDYYCENYSKSN